MDPVVLAAAVTSLGFGGGIVAAINALVQRKKIGADATVVVIAAARELVDPLRQELKTERTERAIDETKFTALLEQAAIDLAACTTEARRTRQELRQVRGQLAALIGPAMANQHATEEDDDA